MLDSVIQAGLLHLLVIHSPRDLVYREILEQNKTPNAKALGAIYSIIPLSTLIPAASQSPVHIHRGIHLLHFGFNQVEARFKRIPLGE
jgi:hypothetical protein